MKTMSALARSAVIVVCCGILGAPLYRAAAHGTARIQQPDGDVKIYRNVFIRIKDEAMAITSSDGRGTIVLGKAACTRVEGLVHCIPYDATLEQHGKSFHIPLQSGTVYLNPTKTQQRLSLSTTTIPPRGVLLSIRTKRGTYVSLSGVIDQVQK